MKKNRWISWLLVFTLLVGAFLPTAEIEAASQDVVISEVESSDANDGNDWVEITNTGTEAVDISGWYITDDKDQERVTENEAWPIADGTSIEPGEYVVLEDSVDFDFGLGKNDMVNLYDASGTQIDSFSWDGLGHAQGTYQRVPGSTEFVDAEPTRGQANTTAASPMEPAPVESAPEDPIDQTPSTPSSDIVINELDSNPSSGNDWIELYNKGTEAIDISGFYVTDDKKEERVSEGKAWPIPDGTSLEPGAYLVLEDGTDFDFGLGKNDAVYLYDNNGNELDAYSWDGLGHPTGSYGRMPNGTGSFVNLEQESKGSENLVVIEPAQSTDIRINEINSSPDDWVELINMGDQAIDLGGFEIRDNSDDHRFRFFAGTIIEPGQLLVVDAHTLGQVYDDVQDVFVEGEFQEPIGIGGGDAIRLYDPEGNLIDSYQWTGHASYNGKEELASYGRYPDGRGNFVLMPETRGENNTWYPPEVVINEVESNGDDTDWVEVYNKGSEPVDMSGWYVMDNDPVGHAADVTPLPEGSILQPGEYFVFDQNTHFTFGLGKNDQASVFTGDGALVAEYAWEGHAEGVYARIPDGIGEFEDFGQSTKGRANIYITPVVLSEIESDGENGNDWIELANPTDEDISLEGLVLENAAGDRYTIPESTGILANGYLVLEGEDFPLELGPNDRLRIYENGRVIQEASWTEHAPVTLGIYPDVNGSEYRPTMVETKAGRNVFKDTIAIYPWPGLDEIQILDRNEVFLEDSSGLDFANGHLYAVDNGTGIFWILDIDQDGTITKLPGFENGKRVRFQKDANDPSAPGPDAEGIAVDDQGLVYIASERDNDDKGVNYNVILQVDPKEEGRDLVAIQEWDLTSVLPDVSANKGIEAVEWVSNDEIYGRLYDQSKDKLYNPNDYPDSATNGVFLTALEDNGHIYAFVLNEDGSADLIADIDSRLGGAMGLHYDSIEDILWVLSDDGYNNLHALIQLNGTDHPNIVHVTPPFEMDTSLNNEGFAISDIIREGLRQVFWFKDGDPTESLRMGWVDGDYLPEDYYYEVGFGYNVIDLTDETGNDDTSKEEPVDTSGGQDENLVTTDSSGDLSNNQAGGNTANTTTSQTNDQGSGRAPQTSDPGMGPYLGLAVLGLVGLFLVSKKEKENLSK